MIIFQVIFIPHNNLIVIQGHYSYQRKKCRTINIEHIEGD